jgi:CheY-like chemotaxis protein
MIDEMNDKPLILVVDDDELLCRSLSDNLTNAGYAVEIARDGTSGLDKALTLKPKLIILDYTMPDIDGLEVLKTLRADEWGQKVEVIFATNTYDMGVINVALGLSVHDYVLKVDTSLDQITELVRKYVPIKT